MFCGCQFIGQDLDSMASQYQDLQGQSPLSVSLGYYFSPFTGEEVVMDGPQTLRSWAVTSWRQEIWLHQGPLDWA